MGIRRLSAVELLIALGLLFFSLPFVEEIKGGDIIVSILLSLVLISGVLVVANNSRTFVVAVLLAIPAVVGRWINHFRPHLLPPVIFLVAVLVLVSFVFADMLFYLLR